MKLMALSLTLGVSVFFLLGFLINSLGKNKKALWTFSIGMAFIVMTGLILFDLVPEILELIKDFSLKNKIIITISSFLGGILILKLIDIIVPHHHHDHRENEKNVQEHKNNLFHMGLITSIALILHNILEGGAIYVTALHDFKAGLLIALGVAAHNIPLGMQIFSTLDLSKKNLKKIIVPLILITFSTTLGALLIFFFDISFSLLVESIFIGIIIGMLFYILVFELFKEIKRNIIDKSLIIGLAVGLIIVVGSTLI